MMASLDVHIVSLQQDIFAIGCIEILLVHPICAYKYVVFKEFIYTECVSPILHFYSKLTEANKLIHLINLCPPHVKVVVAMHATRDNRLDINFPDPPPPL